MLTFTHSFICRWGTRPSMFWNLFTPTEGVCKSVASDMEDCKEEFNFILLATHLGASILVLLVIILVMHTYTSKVAAIINETLSARSQVCCNEYKLPKYRNYQFPSYERFKPDPQQSESSYVDMNRSKTFSYSDRPRFFTPTSVKSETLTR